MQYRHTQFGLFIVVVILLVMIIIIIFSFTNEVIQLALLSTLPILALFLALFYSLSVEIIDNYLVSRFGIGLIRKRILLSEIKAVQSVKNPWYVGWGIRWMPGQYWLWNVSGTGAVELLLKNGTRFRIGTDEPEALVQAIEKNKMLAI